MIDQAVANKIANCRFSEPDTLAAPVPQGKRGGFIAAYFCRAAYAAPYAPPHGQHPICRVHTNGQCDWAKPWRGPEVVTTISDGNADAMMGEQPPQAEDGLGEEDDLEPA